MEEIFNYFKKKKNLVNLLVLGILILGIPLSVNLVKLQQIIKSRADVDPVAFIAGANINKKTDGSWVTKTPTVSFQLTSPLGPPSGAPGAAAAKTVQNSGGLIKTAYADDDSWCTDGKYLCSGDGSVGKQVGTTNGNCQKDGKTCTAWVHYECTITSGSSYCIDNCTDPCTPVSCPTGQYKVTASQIGQQVDNTIVGSNLQPYVPGNGQCGYKYYKWEATLADGNACASYSFGAWADQSKCPKPATSPSPSTPISPPPSGSSPSPGPGNCPLDSKLTISPNPAKVGDTVTFQYQAGEDVYIGDDTFDPSSSVSTCKTPGSAGNPLADRKYICTASNATSNGTWKHLWNVGQPNGLSCGSATYTIIAAQAFTTKFRVAESLADLDTAATITPWKDYTAAVASTPYEYTFKDKAPGQKFIFVQFKDSAGKVTSAADCPKCKAQIKLLGPDPVMTSCSLGFEENKTILNLKGQNFGSDKGTIKSGDTDLTQSIRSWKDDSIQAVLANAPTGQVLPVTITNTDGQAKTDQCSSISQLSLGAKIFCRAPASHDAENVDLVLVDETGKKMRQVVRIDRNGVVQGLTQRLEDGKRYTLSIKVPRSLRRNVTFTAGGGTVSIPNFVLPVGDIFPVDGGDGVINASDKAELNRQFVLTQSGAGRSGDFNQDGRVNSIDWACMRYDYGLSDDTEPTTVPAPVSSPSPSPSPSASASPSPSPTPSPSPSPSVSPSPSPSPSPE